MKDHLKIFSEPRFTFYETAPRTRPASVFAALRHETIFDRNDVTIFFYVQADERSLYQPLNEFTLKADAAPKPIDGGLEIAVTGNDRTLVAIQRIVPLERRR